MNLPDPDTTAISLVNEQITATETPLTEITTQSWIPIMSIGYQTSESVKKGIAKLGDFVLANQTTLGPKIEVLCLDYRVHAILYDLDKLEFDDEIFVPSSYKAPLTQHKEYQAFINQSIKVPTAGKKGKEMQTGADLFFYIPAQQMFATILLKKTLATYIDSIYRAGLGGRLIELSTILMQNRSRTREWYGIAVKQTSRALVGSKLPAVTADVKMPPDLFNKYYKMFINPKKGLQNDEGEVVTGGLER
jgi:hypothetical protein